LLPSSEDWSRVLQQFGNDKDGTCVTLIWS
jgi:hypothetical protein